MSVAHLDADSVLRDYSAGNGPFVPSARLTLDEHVCRQRSCRYATRVSLLNPCFIALLPGFSRIVATIRFVQRINTFVLSRFGGAFEGIDAKRSGLSDSSREKPQGSMHDRPGLSPRHENIRSLRAEVVRCGHEEQAAHYQSFAGMAG
jgi:hypothetical protein